MKKFILSNLIILNVFLSVHAQRIEYETNKNFFWGVGVGLNYQEPKEINDFLDNYFKNSSFKDENYKLGPSVTIQTSSVAFIKSNYFIQTCINGSIAMKILDDGSATTNDDEAWTYTRLSPEMSFNIYKSIGKSSLFAGAGPSFQLISFFGPNRENNESHHYKASGISLLIQAGYGLFIQDDYFQIKFQTDLIRLKAKQVEPDVYNPTPDINRFNYQVFTLFICRNF